MIRTIDCIDGKGLVVFDTNTDDFVFFNPVKSPNDLSLVEDHFLEYAHEVKFFYMSVNPEIEHLINSYEDFLIACKFQTCQGVVLRIEKTIEISKIPNSWTCSNCGSRNQNVIKCKLCGDNVQIRSNKKRLKVS